jgi:hypothetical protein
MIKRSSRRMPSLKACSIPLMTGRFVDKYELHATNQELVYENGILFLELE